MATAKKPAAKKPAPARKAATPAARAAASATKPAKKPVAPPAAKAAAMPPVTAAPAPRAEKPLKAKKPKQVRDSFTMPKTEYVVLDALKLRASKLASPAKKSELLRAGVKALAGMADDAFLAAIKAVPAIKTGRPPAKS